MLENSFVGYCVEACEASTTSHDTGGPGRPGPHASAQQRASVSGRRKDGSPEALLTPSGLLASDGTSERVHQVSLNALAAARFPRSEPTRKTAQFTAARNSCRKLNGRRSSRKIHLGQLPKTGPESIQQCSISPLKCARRNGRSGCSGRGSEGDRRGPIGAACGPTSSRRPGCLTRSWSFGGACASPSRRCRTAIQSSRSSAGMARSSGLRGAVSSAFTPRGVSYVWGFLYARGTPYASGNLYEVKGAA